MMKSEKINKLPKTKRTSVIDAKEDEKVKT